jgi:pimeloyl-ACP methyl ester carboxylesterase
MGETTKTGLFTERYGFNSYNTGRSIVFVHGGPGGNSWAFEKSTAKRLAERNYRVVIYDQRGCGRSKKRYAKDHPDDHTIPRAANDLREVIEHHHLESPILVGHSWGGFLSLNFLKLHPRVAKGLVLVCSPIDYPESFHNILKQVHTIYDGMRSMLRMKHFPRMREIENLMQTMFPSKHALIGPRPQSVAERGNKIKAGDYDFHLDDVVAVFEHARMLDFSTPISLLLNPGYRRLTDKLASLEDSELFLSFNERIGGYFYTGEDCDNHTTECVFEKDNIDLLEGMFEQYKSRIHAIYCDDDRMFSRQQVKRIQETLGRSSRRHFSYIYGASHYPFIEQNRQFLEVLTKHLERIR